MTAADDYPQLAMFATGASGGDRPLVAKRHEARLALDEIDDFRHMRDLVAARIAKADTAVSYDPLKQAERRACVAELDALIAEAVDVHGAT